MSAAGTDVWVAWLLPFGGWERALAPADLVEAGRYAAPLVRRRFLLGRSHLRRVLAGYTGAAAPALRFRQGRHGKPHLTGPRVHFNVSHSREILLMAVSRSGPVGVDVEHVRPIDAEWLVRSWFSPQECREWKRMPPDRRQQAFFHVWCRKEAVLKATGRGLAMQLDQFSVTADPARAELLEFRGRRRTPWRLSRIDAGPGCAAALATWGDPGTINIREIA